MTEWIIPCNPKLYKVDEAFSELKRLDWRQTSFNPEVGDIVYIYVSSPVMAIRYKCKVTKVNLQTIEIDDSKYIINKKNFPTRTRYMELELIGEFEDELTREVMAQNGVKGNIQCPRRANPELLKYISEL